MRVSAAAVFVILLAAAALQPLRAQDLPPNDFDIDTAKSCAQLASEIRQLKAVRPKRATGLPPGMDLGGAERQLTPQQRAELYQALSDDDTDERAARIEWLTETHRGKRCAAAGPESAPAPRISLEALPRTQKNLIHCDSVFQTIGLVLLRNPPIEEARPIHGLYSNLGQSNRELWREAIDMDPADRANRNLFYRKRDTYLGDYFERNVRNYAQLRGDYDQCINSHIFPGPASRTARRSDYYRN